jgi:hypothetical protein
MNLANCHLANCRVNQVVGSISSRDRKILEELVRDTMLYGLNERESLMYVRKRAVDISISRANLYNIKKRISHNEVNMLEERFTNHTRVGYALSHFQVMDQIKGMQKILFQALLEESSKLSEKKNLFAMSRSTSLNPAFTA